MKILLLLSSLICSYLNIKIFAEAYEAKYLGAFVKSSTQDFVCPGTLICGHWVATVKTCFKNHSITQPRQVNFRIGNSHLEGAWHGLQVKTPKFWIDHYVTVLRLVHFDCAFIHNGFVGSGSINSNLLISDDPDKSVSGTVTLSGDHKEESNSVSKITYYPSYGAITTCKQPNEWHFCVKIFPGQYDVCDDDAGSPFVVDIELEDPYISYSSRYSSSDESSGDCNSTGRSCSSSGRYSSSGSTSGSSESGLDTSGSNSGSSKSISRSSWSRSKKYISGGSGSSSDNSKSSSRSSKSQVSKKSGCKCSDSSDSGSRGCVEKCIGCRNKYIGLYGIVVQQEDPETCENGTALYLDISKHAPWIMFITGMKPCPAKITSVYQTTSPEPETTPDILTTTPEFSTKIPEISTTTPELSTTTPEVPTTTPEISTTIPEISTATPEVSTPTPEVSTTIPEISTTTSEVSTTTPEVYTITSVATETTTRKGSWLLDLNIGPIRVGAVKYFVAQYTIGTRSEAIAMCDEIGMKSADTDPLEQLQGLSTIIEMRGYEFSQFLLSGYRTGGVFSWSNNGQPVNFNAWKPGYPLSDVNKNCMYLLGGVWINDVCETKHNFICK